MEIRNSEYDFPPLPYAEWADSKLYLHKILQMVGKIRLALHPRLNHWWHVTLAPSPRGLTTGLIPYGDRDFEIEVNLQNHLIEIRTCEGETRRIPLGKLTVAEIYQALMDNLSALGYPVIIYAHPYGISSTTPFAQDTATPKYYPAMVERYHHILNEVSHIFKEFCGGYVGKASPVQWFWHSFDLAYTRFSGRKAPPRTTGTRVDQEAYSHEEISFGFWPGDDNFPQAAFYAYAYPSPQGLTSNKLSPEKAFWGDLGGSPYAFFLYEDMRNAPDPRAALLAYMDSMYQISAKQAQWPMAELALAAPAQ